MKKSKISFLNAAKEAAILSGKLLTASFGHLKLSQISSKAKNDFVTEIDKDSEKLIISTIKKYFPGHAIQAEESGIRSGKGVLWVIDPLDGTSNYIHHIPMFCISIGVLKDNKPIAAVVYDPTHSEMFTAEKGKGAYLNGHKIRVTQASSLAQSLMATGIPFRARERFGEYMASFDKISMASVGVRRCGAAALDLAYVACGRFDGFWELDLSPWDIAAGALLIEEAGGKITDLWGQKNYFKNGDTLASNGIIHKELVKITSKIFTPLSKDKRCLLS